MKRLRRLFLAFVLVTMLVRPGLGCSHEGSSAVFVQVFSPDQPYAAYVHGRLGVIGRAYYIRHLVVAYDILSGQGLSPAEQHGADEVDQRYSPESYLKPGDPTPSDDGTAHGEGFERWSAAVPGTATIATERRPPGENYDSFTNCLDGAFARAATTLAKLRSSYSRPGAPDPPEVQNWIAGQQAVFSNCSASGQMPQPVPANAPLWLRQERAYQIAAAKFYALDYTGALAGFQAIAADKSSPNAPLSRYIVARVLIRQGQMTFNPYPTSQAQAEANDEARKPLQQARAQLEGILADPSMKAWHQQSRQLLDLVMLRVDPAKQAEDLAKRVTEAQVDDATYKQAVIDLGYAYRDLPRPARSMAMQLGKPAPIEPHSPFLRWMDDIYGANTPPRTDIGLDRAMQISRTDAQRRQDALDVWHSTHGLQWLVAALTIAQSGDPDAAELIAAAKAVPASSPAFASVTYHRLRLAMGQPKDQSGVVSFQEVSALLPEIEHAQSHSTINLYLDMQAGLAPSLESFLHSAAQLPASYTDYDGDETGETTPDYPINNPNTLCGVNVYAPKTPHFDPAVATVFNQRMPLTLLRDAALLSALPNNLRFQLAHMAWTRALLLDQPEIARALSPMLAGCQPAIKPWLDSYNAAATADERHVLGLLAMMRFTSTEPLVRVGGERDFAAYDFYRDNWWCNEDKDWDARRLEANKAKPPMLFSQRLVSTATQPDPRFLTDTDRAQLKTELPKLEQIPCASDYFGQQALAWVNAHPNDSHNSDVLGFAMRVTRNACRTDATTALSHQLFDTLHRRYPKSEWAAKYKTWE